MDEDIFRQFFLKFREMKEVKLSKVEAVSDNTLYLIANSCPLVEILDVSYCWRISDTGIKQVFKDLVYRMLCR